MQNDTELGPVGGFLAFLLLLARIAFCIAGDNYQPPTKEETYQARIEAWGNLPCWIRGDYPERDDRPDNRSVLDRILCDDCCD